jgi:hypothetical protein
MRHKEKAEKLFQLYLPFVESGNIEEIKNRCDINEALLNYIYEFIFNENSGITGFVGATGPFSLINELIYF